MLIIVINKETFKIKSSIPIVDEIYGATIFNKLNFRFSITIFKFILRESKKQYLGLMRDIMNSW